MKSRLFVLAILGFPILMCGIAWYLWFSPVTTVILVRHAERLNNSDTTSLSGQGTERARRLAVTLRSLEVKRIYVSEKSRTHQTAGPIASMLGILPTQIPANSIKTYTDSIRAHPGEAILIVGHSDTLPLILAKLGINPAPTISSTEFDNLFVVSLLRFRSTLAQLRY
jgi:broad specificity phosphatase PhoE